MQPLGGGQAGSVVAAGPEVSISERDDLDRAIGDVKQGRFDLGEDRLRGFLTTYPGSPLVPSLATCTTKTSTPITGIWVG